MSGQRLCSWIVMALLLLGPTGLLRGEDDHADGDHGHAATAEVEPGAEGDHAGGELHGATDSHAGSHDAHGDSHGGEHHDPYADALHGNATPVSGAVTGQDAPAEIKWDLAFWTLVVFGCLTAILWKFAWGPICAALDSRESSIQQNIDSAKELNDKAAALLADHEARLAGTADEVRKILDEARRDAETQKQGIIAEAEAAAESQKNLALQEISAAKNGALQELAEKSVDTAVGLAGKIVKQQLSKDDHASLISDAISNFPSNN